MGTLAIATLVGFMLAALSSLAIFAIALAEHIPARVAGSDVPVKNPQSQFRGWVLGVPIVTVLAVSRLPCSLWPWLIEHAMLSAGLCGGLIAGGAGLTIALSKPGVARWHRALRVVGKFLVLAGVAGLVSTATFRGGCPLPSEAALKPVGQSSSQKAPDDSPAKAMFRVVARQMAWSTLALEGTVQALREEFSASSDAASGQRPSYARLAKLVEQFSRSTSLAGAVFAIGFAALLVLATRRGVDAWAARSGGRRVARGVMVGLAGIAFLPFCFSVVGVYLGQVLAPAYIVSAWAAGTALGIVVTLWLVLVPSATRLPAAAATGERHLA